MAAQTELILSTVVKGTETATKALNDVKGSLDGIGGSTNGVSSKLLILGKSFVKIGTIGATALSGLGLYGLKTAGNFEQTATAFQTMLGDGKKSGDLLKDLSDFSKETPFEFTEVADAGKSLLAFGLEAKDVKGTLRTLGDTASSLGIPLGDMAEIYGKIKTQGRVFSEDINQLTGRGIPIIGELAKQFGVAEGDIKKLVETGKVGFPEIKTAMEDMAGEGGRFSGGMINQSKTLQGMLSNAKDGLGNILNEIIGINQRGEIEQGSIIEKAKNITSSFVTFLDQNKENIKAFFTLVSDGFGSFFETLGIIINTGLGIIKEFWKNNGEEIKGIVQSTISFLKDFWTNYGNEITLVLDVIKGIFSIAFKIVKELIVGVMNVIGPIIRDTFIIIGESIRAVSKLLTGDFSGAWESVQVMIKGILDILGTIIMEFFNLVAKVFGTDIVTVIDTAISYLQTKAQQAKDYISDIMEAYSLSSVGQSLQNFGYNTYDFIHGTRATGGPVGGGKSYLVGEKGPEIFTPGTSGQIIPNNKIGGGGGIVINFTGTFGQDAAEEIGNMIVSKLTRASYV